MKFYDLKRRKQISLFTPNGTNGNSTKKGDVTLNSVTSHDPSAANLICLLGATSVNNPSSNSSSANSNVTPTKSGVALKSFSTLNNKRTKNFGSNSKGMMASSNILDRAVINGRYNSIGSSHSPPPLSSLTTIADSLSSGRSSSSDSESGKKMWNFGKKCCNILFYIMFYRLYIITGEPDGILMANA